MNDDDEDIGILYEYPYYTRCGMNDDDEDIGMNIHTTQGAA
jgi:hypothetical protein